MNELPIIERNLTIDGEPFALVVTTHHEGVLATTAIHRHRFQRRVGGARFVERAGGLSEVGHLSSTMSDKCLAAMVPADGQKTVIVVGSGPYLSEERRAQILVEHVRVVREVDPGTIVGPDMNNPESVVDRAARAEGMLDHFTGLSEVNRGLSIDANGYTAHGLVAAIRACIDDATLRNKRVSIQGFGAVGAHTARLLAELGATIVAVNNKDELFTNPDGLDIASLWAHRLRYGDDGFKNYSSDATGFRVSSTPDEIFQVPADIFVPASRTDILATTGELDHVRRTENPNVNNVADFHVATGVSLVVEGANHPLSLDAERWLESKGVRILPDFIVNCGGLIGCWMEWEARHRDGLYPTVDLHVVGERALERVRTTVTKNVRELLALDLPARVAAERIVSRNRELMLTGHRGDDRFRSHGGVIALVRELNETETPLHVDPIFIKDEHEGEGFEIALQWNDGNAENIRCFTNAMETAARYAHRAAFKNALVSTFNKCIAGHGVSVPLVGEDIHEGLVAVISITIGDTTPLKVWVERVVSERLETYFYANPSDAKRIIDKVAAPAARNQAEALARTELKALRYASAITALRVAMAFDPARAERLQNEFGFLLRAYGEEGNIFGVSGGAADRLQWSARIWRTIAAGNDLPLPDLMSVRNEAPKAAEPRAPIVKAQKETAEQKGEILEDAVSRLFRTFFRIGEEVPWKIRKQKRGSQYGYDLSIEWSGKCDAVGEPKSRCHIECKNYKDDITPAIVSEKLFSEPRKEAVIDHWILISPRSNPSNELNRFLEQQLQEGTFPFAVQVWSPEKGVDELFGLEPAVYEHFYEAPKGEPHPRDWDEAKRNEVREKWRKLLEPPLRLPPGWSDYLRDPALLCIHQEDPVRMDQTWETRVAMRCRNDAGSLLEKPLDDYIDDWLSSNNPVCFLLGEFGDGKSFFSYSLARRLVADWRKGPGAWIPLRLALRKLPPDPRDFLRQRLEVFGADVAGWNVIGKTARRLVILDGFDEMSTALDPNTVTGNIRRLLACLDEFAGCKILITSRTHFFQNRRDAQRLLTRAGPAQIYTLARIPRSEVIRNLIGAAPDAERRQVAERLRSMNDPIGLAGKPLFLEMLKDVLVDSEMPADFDVVTLYERYITRSLTRKPEYLNDPELQTTPADTIANLRAVLSEIAEKLQRTGQGYVRLSELASATFAKLLWNLSGPEALDLDAKARIGGRSLLSQVDTDDAGEWPVDFCHRSMREYFVAERLCTALETGRSAAEVFLRTVPVNHEILQFAVHRLRKFGSGRVEATLLTLLGTGQSQESLGGRALTLLYRLNEYLPRDFDWRRKNFDGADLEGADLSGLDFSGSSLRNAILANVNFEDSNFSGCDLTGVRIEETKPVAALAADPSGERIIAAYSDGALRSWEIAPDGRAASTQVGKWPPGVCVSIGLHESGQIWLHANDEWWFLSRQEAGPWDQVARFPIADTIAGIRPRDDVLAVTHAGFDGGAQFGSLVDLQRNVNLCTATPGATRHCAPLGSEGLVWSDAAIGFRVEKLLPSGLRRTIDLPCRKPSSLDVRTRSNGMHVVAGGTEEGMVHVWELETRDDGVAPHEIFARSIHDGAVTAVALFEDARVASGGSDCVIAVTTWADDCSAEVKYRLQLRLRCRGMRIEGLESEAERLVLRKLIDDAEAIADR